MKLFLKNLTPFENAMIQKNKNQIKVEKVYL
jgi:hypothetical protein